jgi:hypothetical protein
MWLVARVFGLGVLVIPCELWAVQVQLCHRGSRRGAAEETGGHSATGLGARGWMASAPSRP